jgi:hypothetical protein
MIHIVVLLFFSEINMNKQVLVKQSGKKFNILENGKHFIRILIRNDYLLAGFS